MHLCVCSSTQDPTTSLRRQLEGPLSSSNPAGLEGLRRILLDALRSRPCGEARRSRLNYWVAPKALKEVNLNYHSIDMW